MPNRSVLKCRVLLREIPLNYPHKDLWELRMEIRRLKPLAASPPQMLKGKPKFRQKLTSSNNLLKDPMLTHLREMSAVQWSQEEREVFGEQFHQHPKDFARIATFLEGKIRKDCVQFYYLSKKKVAYTQRLTKQEREQAFRIQFPKKLG
eukprot:GFUD01018048.1.p1 GENE.GFUD01018048.1~~GFUD01018048.1.p1  ORF type:complete len:149 (+),score=14.96 GFUD01018048.1:207-653(+)